MTSILGTQSIQHPNGTASATILADGTFSSPGHILQTVISISTVLASTTNTNLDTPTDYLSASITPKFSTSKILIRGNIIGGGSAAGIGVNFFIKAGGSFMTTTELGNNQAGLLAYGFGRADGVQDCFSFDIFDSPATTSSFTYTVAFGRYGGSGTGYAGWHNSKSRSSLTLMEIAQ